MKVDNGIRKHRVSLLILVSVALLFGSSVLVPAPVSASPAFGTLLISGSSWLGGNGVDVYSNNNFNTVSNDYSAPAVGMKWQCVELAQRLYTARGWRSGIFSNVGVAADIWTQATNLGMQRFSNGSGYVPVPGDMIIHAATGSEPSGHVSIVDSVGSSSIAAVEQNWDGVYAPQTGRGTYGWNGSTASRGSSTILGFVHDPDNLNTASRRRRSGDYNGDGTTDIATYRPSDGSWHIRNQTAEPGGIPHGWPGDDVPVPGDYNGDGVTDIATYRPSDGSWHIRNQTAEPGGIPHGWPGDVPVPGDYNGDGATDIATYRPSDGSWHIRNQTAEPGGIPHGWPGDDVPVPGDYNGDGATDIATYRRSDNSWHIRNQTSEPSGIGHGWTGDIPVPSASQYLTWWLSTPPAAPSGATAVVTGQSIGVRWVGPDAVPSKMLRSLTTYIVRRQDGTVVCTAVGRSSCSVSGASTGVSYTFTVTARNLVGGQSPPSGASNSVSIPGSTGVLAGKVNATGGLPSGTTIRLFGSSRSVPISIARVGVDGTWTATIAPGAYEIEVVPMGGRFRRSWAGGTSLATASTFTVVGSTTTNGGVVVLTPR